MSVIVENLTKKYGDQKAVDDISFEVKKGEILGFLGPNGAGKSTTMKIITCFIPQSGGKVSVCDKDTHESPLEVRQQIGYLPEHNPLYLDMYVREYLEFIASLHQITGQKAAQRIEEMLELTGLQQERKKRIKQLSKGYRQRVGLAQAMIHDPKVLILDEPTSGLDPNQLAEIRQVIKTLGQQKTVILSTHIMQEVQALCDRVIIIDKGKIVTDDTAESLQNRTQQKLTITIEFKENVNQETLLQIPDIQRLENLGKNKFKITTNNNKDLRSELFNFAVKNNLTLLTLQKQNANLEDIFRQVTAS